MTIFARIFPNAAVMAIAAMVTIAGVNKAHAADPPKLPAGVTCSDIRAKVAEHGKIAAYAWARLQGYSSKEINEARKCLNIRSGS